MPYYEKGEIDKKGKIRCSLNFIGHKNGLCYISLIEKKIRKYTF